MSSHQRFSASLVLVAAMVALGACGKDPTGVESVAAPSVAPATHPLTACSQGGVPGVHGDTIVDEVRGLSEAQDAEREQMLACLKQQ